MVREILVFVVLVAAVTDVCHAVFRCTPVNGDNDRRPRTRMATDDCWNDVAELNKRVGDGKQFSCHPEYNFTTCPFWDNGNCYKVTYILSECPRPKDHPLYTGEKDPNLQNLDDAVGNGFNAECGHHRRRNYTTGHDHGTYSIAVFDCRNVIQYINQLIKATIKPTTASPTVAPSPPPITCDVPSVTSPLKILNLPPTITQMQLGQTAVFGCTDSHHELVGSRIVQCVDQNGEGQTKPQIPECKKLQCEAQALSAPANGSIVSMSTDSGGDGITFACDDGFDMVGEPKVTCTGESWDGEAPVCTPKTCDDIALLWGSATYPDGKEFGRTAMINCNTGYGNAVGTQPVCSLSTTKDDVEWSPQPSCKPIQCDVPVTTNPSTTNQTSSVGFGESIGFQCGQGKIFGDGTKVTTVKCIDGTVEIPQCVDLQCNKITIGRPNMTLSGDKPLWSEGETMNVKCELGFSGNSKEFTCTDGVFAPSPLSIDCTPLPLPPFPAPANSILVEDGTDLFVLGLTYVKYQCSAPWSGNMTYILDANPNTNELAWVLARDDEDDVTDPISECIAPPTMSPTLSPTMLPTIMPTAYPSQAPTSIPTTTPTTSPSTTHPSIAPTAVVTTAPSMSPTKQPAILVSDESKAVANAAMVTTISIIVVVIVVVVIVAVVAIFFVMKNKKGADDARNASFDNPMYDNVVMESNAEYNDGFQSDDIAQNSNGYMDVPASNVNQGGSGYMDIAPQTKGYDDFNEDDEEDV